MGGSLLAELTKLRLRPSTWIMLGLFALFLILFGYVLPYLGAVLPAHIHPSGQSASDTARAQASAAEAKARLLHDTRFVAAMVAGLMPVLGALTLIIGAETSGSEYGWGTIKTILIQRPTRLTIFAMQMLALAIGALAFVLIALVLGFIAGAFVRAGLGASDVLVWPSALDLVKGIAVSWLILATYTAFGVALAVLVRGAGVAIGIGLVVLLIVEPIVVNLVGAISFLSDVPLYALSTNAGALAGSLGTEVQDIGAGQATLVLMGYGVVFLAVAGLLFYRRDVT